MHLTDKSVYVNVAAHVYTRKLNIFQYILSHSVVSHSLCVFLLLLLFILSHDTSTDYGKFQFPTRTNRIVLIYYKFKFKFMPCCSFSLFIHMNVFFSSISCGSVCFSTLNAEQKCAAKGTVNCNKRLRT